MIKTDNLTRKCSKKTEAFKGVSDIRTKHLRNKEQVNLLESRMSK